MSRRSVIIDHFHVMSLLPCWRTITKYSSSATIVSSTNVAATSLSFDYLGIDCKPSICDLNWSRYHLIQYNKKEISLHSLWSVVCVVFILYSLPSWRSRIVSRITNEPPPSWLSWSGSEAKKIRKGEGLARSFPPCPPPLRRFFTLSWI